MHWTHSFSVYYIVYDTMDIKQLETPRYAKITWLGVKNSLDGARVVFLLKGGWKGF